MSVIKKTILCIVSLLMLGLNCTSVFADEVHYDSSLVFGPPTQRIMLEAGQTFRSSMYISNPSDSVRSTKYVVYVTPYGVDTNYTPVFDQVNSYTQIVDWITLDKTEGVLQPGEKHSIGFTIKVPEDAPSGGQYATIMAQDVTDLDSEDDNGLSISNVMAIGAVVYADVAGTTRNEAEIISNSFPSILFNNTLSAESLVRNNGNVHTDAKYTLQVWPLFSSEEICTNEENPSESLIMPETEKYHVETCDKLPMIGIFRVKNTVQIFGETSIVEKTIIVCPLWLLAIILFAIILLVMWIVMKVRARRKE